MARIPVLRADSSHLERGVVLRSGFRVYRDLEEDECVEIQLGLSLGATLILTSI